MFYIENSYCISQKISHELNGDRAFQLCFETKPTNEDKIFIQCVLDGVSTANDNYSSSLACKILCEKLSPILVNINRISTLSPSEKQTFFFEALKEAILEADKKLYDDPIYCATTTSIAIIFQNCIFTANIGDSPIYLANLQEKNIIELYTNHNEAGELKRKGIQLKNKAELRKKQRHLNKSVGGKTLLSESDISLISYVLPQESILILGSDGALSFLDEKECEDIIFNNAENMEALCHNLYYNVVEKDGYDDFTVFATRLKVSQ